MKELDVHSVSAPRQVCLEMVQMKEVQRTVGHSAG